MFTQKQFFKALMMSALFFISRTLTAVSPQKSGFQHHAIVNETQWDFTSIMAIIGAGLIAYFGGKLLLNMVKYNSVTKSSRYDN